MIKGYALNVAFNGTIEFGTANLLAKNIRNRVLIFKLKSNMARV